MTYPTFILSCAHIINPRIERCKKYDLLDILFLTLCAEVSDAEDWEDIEIFGKHKLDWLRRFHPFISGFISSLPLDASQAFYTVRSH